jgi:predicted acylesterase/phospholipase RssA
MGSVDVPQLVNTADLLNQKSEPKALSEFLISAVYSGLESPIRALAQVVDQHAKTDLDNKVKSGFKALGVEAPEPAKFNTSNWYAQQAGGAAGMMLPFFGLRSGIQATLGNQLAEKTLLSTGSSLTKLAANEALLSGATGLAFGALLSPSKESNVGTSAFYTDRLKSGLADMTSFAAMGFMSPYIGKGLSAVAAPLDSVAMNSASRGVLDATLKGPILAGAISGVPNGFVGAQINAWKDGRKYATADEVKESIVGMSFVGGALGTANWLANKAASGKGNETKQEAPQTREQQAIASKAETTPVLREQPVTQTQRANARLIPDSSSPKTADGKVNSVPEPVQKAGENAKFGSDKITAKEHLPGFEIVLGASGVEAPAHVGFLRALEESRVPIDKIMGASGGALVATFYANGYKAADLNKILLSNEFRYPSATTMAKCFHLADPWNLFPHRIDFRPWLQEVVNKYDLKPQPSLRIVAADATTKAPVIFEGTNYDLVTALTASTAAVTIGMKPPLYNGRTLVDGVYYHPIPADLAKAPALVSKIGFANKLPTQPLSPWDFMMHMREMMLSSYLNSRFPDPKGHIIAETGMRDVSTSSFGIGTEALKKLIEHGYESTSARLKQPDAIEAMKNRSADTKPQK